MTNNANNQNQAPYVDASKAKTTNKYVAWIDVMGAGGMMVRSLPNTLNFTLKLQVAALEAKVTDVRLFPMNDGVFATSDSIFPLKDLIARMYERIQLANSKAEGQMSKVFVARAAIAFGPVFDGSTITQDCSATLANDLKYAGGILIGAPVVNAHRSEQSTGPFGVFVHESARIYGPDRWSGSLMRYWDTDSPPEWIAELKGLLNSYLDHAMLHPNELDYPADSIAKHRDLAREFFNDPEL